MNKSEPSVASSQESTPRDQKGSSTPKTPTKPILKRERSEKNNRRSLVWDEENLHLNEIQRTPKMKIDEPKTPYHHHDNGLALEGDEEPAEGERELRSPPEGDTNFLEHWEEFHNAMEKVHHKQQKTSSPGSGRESRGSPATTTLHSARRRSTGSQAEAEADRISGGETSGSESDSDRKHFKKEEFIKRRKAHYNEFLVFKTLRDHELDEDGEADASHSQQRASSSTSSSSGLTPAPAAAVSSANHHHSPQPHANSSSNGHQQSQQQQRQSSPAQRSASSPALTSKIKTGAMSSSSSGSGSPSGGRHSGKGIGFALPPKNT